MGPVLLDESIGKTTNKHGYYNYTAIEKARVPQYAAECEITSTVRYFVSE